MSATEARAFFEQHGTCPECASRVNVNAYRRGDHVGLWCDRCDRWIRWVPHRLLSRPIGDYVDRSEAGALPMPAPRLPRDGGAA